MHAKYTSPVEVDSIRSGLEDAGKELFADSERNTLPLE